ncbi:MAG: NAD(P)H-binding protein [Verrucomicrobia bacterium]|nr:NAD(P)H-binding protein [Verrucomicrobiota bacterium]
MCAILGIKSSRRLSSGNAEIASGNLADPSTLNSCFDGIKSAFLLTPVSQQTVELKRNFIHAAKHGGIRRIVDLSVAGASPKSPVNLFRWHWEAEQDLESSGVSWTHLRPTDLTRYSVKAILPSVQAKGVFYSTIGEGRVAMVDEVDLAEAAAAALTQDAHEGKTYTLTGPEALSYSQLAGRFVEESR